MKKEGGKISKWKQKLSNQPDEKNSSGVTLGTSKSGGTHSNAQNSIQQLQLQIQIHNEAFSKEDVLLNSDQFENALKEGDFLEIIIQVQQGGGAQFNFLGVTSSNQSLQHGSKSGSPSLGMSPSQGNNSPQHQSNNTGLKKMVVKVGKDSIRQQRFQISILKQIADLHNLKAGIMCKVRYLNADIRQNAQNQNVKIGQSFLGQQSEDFIGKGANAQEAETPSIQPYIIDRLEVTFRDQLVSRRDMYKIQHFLDSKAVYKNRLIEYMGIRFTIRALFNKQDHEIQTGVVKLSETKFSFYSKSSQVYILIELSEEMYQFDENGFLNHEKCIQFLKAYFERCIKSNSSHEVTLVIYSRLYYPQVKNKEELREALGSFFRKTEPMTDGEIDELGAFQISKHTKVFQDIYLKVGLFEIGRGSWEKNLQNLKKYFNYLPSMINWHHRCPPHVQDLKKFYPREMVSSNGSFVSSMEEFFQQQNQSIAQSHYMMGCQVGNAEKQNILEAINLALFNLNNEEEDQNLKQTGQQLLIITAGFGAYRINANVVEPTKSRVQLGGIPIQLISLNRKPPYKTPLLINCCTYANPFKTKFQNKKGVLVDAVNALQASDKKQSEEFEKYLENQNSDGSKCPQGTKNSNPPYYFPYWLDLIYLPFTKIFEVHGPSITNPQSAIYKVQKIPPYLAQHGNYDFQPHQGFSYLDAINQLEKQAVKDKLISPQRFVEESLESQDLQVSNQRDSFLETSLNPQSQEQQNERFVIFNTSEYILQPSSLNSQGKKELLKTLEREDNSIFKSGQETGEIRDASPGFQGKRKKHGVIHNRQERLSSSYQKRQKRIDDPYDISGNLKIENMSVNSLNSGYVLNVQRELDPYANYDEDSNQIDRYAQSLQDKNSLEDLLSQNTDNFYDKVNPGHNGIGQNKIFKKAVPNPFPGGGIQNSMIQISSPKVGQVSQTSGQISRQPKGSPQLIMNTSQVMESKNKIMFDPFQTELKDDDKKQQDMMINNSRQQHKYMEQNSFEPMKSSQSIPFSIKPIQALGGGQITQQLDIQVNKKSSAMKSRWAHQPRIQDLQAKLTDTEFEVMLHYGSVNQLNVIMEPFWKSLCECKLMPLTTDFFPGEKELQTMLGTKYQYEPQTSLWCIQSPFMPTVQDYLNEYICLRLTQNFQLITPNPTCHVDFKELTFKKTDIKMSMCNKYDILSHIDKDQFAFEIYTKMQEGTKEIQIRKQADFKYMLYNYHTNQFQVKTSSESRLFNFSSLLNLGSVLEGKLIKAMKSCIKLPQNHFVIFYQNDNWVFSKQQQQSLNTNSSSSIGSSTKPLFPQRLGDVGASFGQQPNASRQSIMSMDHQQTMIHSSLGNSQMVDSENNQNQNENVAQAMEIDHEEREEAYFKDLKMQLYEMLTRNKKSKFNNQSNLKGINQLQVLREGKGVTGVGKSTVFIEDEQGERVLGAYFILCDKFVQTQHCFHITISWIFANGPQISEKINSLKRKVKSCGLQIVQISGVSNKERLNPFENFTRLKTLPRTAFNLVDGRLPSSQRGSFDEESEDQYGAQILVPNYQTRAQFFTYNFDNFLRHYYGFVIESESNIYKNYIHSSGLALLRAYQTSEVAWIENDVVNNQMADYSESHRIQEKVEILIFALDLIIDLAMDMLISDK